MMCLQSAPVARIAIANLFKTNGDLGSGPATEGRKELNKPKSESLPMDVEPRPGAKKEDLSNAGTSASIACSFATNTSGEHWIWLKGKWMVVSEGPQSNAERINEPTFLLDFWARSVPCTRPFQNASQSMLAVIIEESKLWNCMIFRISLIEWYVGRIWNTILPNPAGPVTDGSALERRYLCRQATNCVQWQTVHRIVLANILPYQQDFAASHRLRWFETH